MKSYFRIIAYARRYWKHLFFAISCSMMFSLTSGISVYLTIPLLDTLFQETKTFSAPAVPNVQVAPQGMIDDIKNGLNHAVQSFVLTGNKLDGLLRICFIILGAFLLKNIFGYFSAYFMSVVEQGAMRDIRDDAYRHLHQLPLGYFKNERTGNLISRIINDVNVVQNSISASFVNLIREPLSILVFLGMAVSISWQLTLFSFLILPFSMLIISWLGLKLRKHAVFIQEKMADITNVLQETITGVKIVKAFGMEEYENRKFSVEIQRFFKLMIRISRVRHLAPPTTEFLSVVVGVVIVYFGGRLVLVDNTLKASEFLGFLFAIFQMMPPIKELSGVNSRIQEADAAGDRIFEILDTPPSIVNIANPVLLNTFTSNIEFKDVTFKYDDADEPVLSNINFNVRKGEIIALVGPSGGGKSTLVDLIPRFYDVSSGAIYIDGQDIKSVQIKSLRSLMGIVTQETILFNESIRNNIAYGLNDLPLEQIIQAAKMANAHKFIEEMPNGYNTVIGERGVKISGGQRQRLSIARALLKNPEIMIFDEATSALDNESELLVQEAIERLMVNRTSFIIAHRLSTIRNASRILVVDKGQIVQAGSHDDLILEEHGLYKKLYEMQFGEQ
ncbi:MAG: ABC transporter ATP-binding protein/permease [Ignavibacteria bacterium]|nr:ABC transporter ATP-binding protein/permease [Ignavibacteria bacterium]